MSLLRFLTHSQLNFVFESLSNAYKARERTSLNITIDDSEYIKYKYNMALDMIQWSKFKKTEPQIIYLTRTQKHPPIVNLRTKINDQEVTCLRRIESAILTGYYLKQVILTKIDKSMVLDSISTEDLEEKFRFDNSFINKIKNNIEELKKEINKIKTGTYNLKTPSIFDIFFTSVALLDPEDSKQRYLKFSDNLDNEDFKSNVVIDTYISDLSRYFKNVKNKNLPNIDRLRELQINSQNIFKKYPTEKLNELFGRNEYDNHFKYLLNPLFNFYLCAREAWLIFREFKINDTHSSIIIDMPTKDVLIEFDNIIQKCQEFTIILSLIVLNNSKNKTSSQNAAAICKELNDWALQEYGIYIPYYSPKKAPVSVEATWQFASINDNIGDSHLKNCLYQNYQLETYIGESRVQHINLLFDSYSQQIIEEYFEDPKTGERCYSPFGRFCLTKNSVKLSTTKPGIPSVNGFVNNHIYKVTTTLPKEIAKSIMFSFFSLSIYFIFVALLFINFAFFTTGTPQTSNIVEINEIYSLIFVALISINLVSFQKNIEKITHYKRLKNKLNDILRINLLLSSLILLMLFFYNCVSNTIFNIFILCSILLMVILNLNWSYDFNKLVNDITEKIESIKFSHHN